MAGAGKAEVAIPEGSAQQVHAGTQLVLQLHLLNASAEPVTEYAEVRMDRSPAANPNPVGQFIFGTFDLAPPPKRPSQLQIDCTVNGDVQIFAMFPHMHYLGRKLELQLGPNAGSLSPIYTRDPYAFEQQTIDPLEIATRRSPTARARPTRCASRSVSRLRRPAAGLGGGCFGKGSLPGAQ